jgi:hypothetical protein
MENGASEILHLLKRIKYDNNFENYRFVCRYQLVTNAFMTIAGRRRIAKII